MARSLLLLALAGAVVAQRTVDLLLPLGDEEPLEASIIASDASATTYLVNCPTGTPSDECGMPPDGLPITQGPSTWIMTLSLSPEDGIYSQDARCQLDLNKNTASCTMSLYQEYDGTTETSSTQTVEKNIKTLMLPVTITATNDAATPSKTTDAASKATTDAASETTTIVKSSSASKTSEETSSSSAPNSSESTPESTPDPDSGAGHMMTMNALLAGVAAAVGGALML